MQGRPARGDPLDLEAVALQAASEGLGDRFIVFHQKYAHRRTLVLESWATLSSPRAIVTPGTFSRGLCPDGHEQT
ncbi:predicted protein [Streptomyces azureus]|uniref:Uncharacterized protein n=1 Tax=Streptomyces azureus TaxID=146537 RepID=A0A0K8PED1_STRAJ|nr:predicted protein [Streptomyces azureus]